MDYFVVIFGMLDVVLYCECLYVSSWFGMLDVILQDVLIDIVGVCCLGVGEIFFQCGDVFDGLYCVVEGMICIGVMSVDGCEVLLVVLELVNWFGEIGVFDC